MAAACASWLELDCLPATGALYCAAITTPRTYVLKQLRCIVSHSQPGETWKLLLARLINRGDHTGTGIPLARFVVVGGAPADSVRSEGYARELRGLQWSDFSSGPDRLLPGRGSSDVDRTWRASQASTLLDFADGSSDDPTPEPEDELLPQPQNASPHPPPQGRYMPAVVRDLSGALVIIGGLTQVLLLLQLLR